MGKYQDVQIMRFALMGFYYTDRCLIDAPTTEERIHFLVLFVLSGRPLDRCSSIGSHTQWVTGKVDGRGSYH